VTPSGSPWSPDRRLLTVGLIGLVTAGAFEGMAVPTVLPALVDDLGGLDLYGWAFSAFWLTNIIGITLGGADADRHGPRRSLLVGSLLFAAGMTVAGLAGSMPVVIGGRAIQGFGSGAIASVVYAVIARAYAPSAAPRMIALTSSAWIVPGLIGPALAGAVSDAIGWRWVFLAIVPVVVLMGVTVAPQLRQLGPVVRETEPLRGYGRRALDAVRLAIGSTLVLAALQVASGGDEPLLGAIPSWAVAIALGAGGLWLVVGALVHLLPVGSLRLARGRPAIFGAVFAITFAFFGTEAYIPLMIVGVRGETVTVGGIALSAAAVTWSVGAWVQARAAGAGTRGTLVAIGSALIAAGIGLAALVLLPDLPILAATAGWAVGGLGMGLAYSMLAFLTLETAPRGEEGASSASLQLMFTLGTAFGAGAGGAVVALADRGALELVQALGAVDAVMVAVAIGAMLAALRVPRRPAPRTDAQAASAPSVPAVEPG
jgi:MFS family permease